MANICILRLSALGDVSHVLPVVRVIQEQAPDIDITWVCGKLEHQILSGIEGVRFVVFDKKAGIRAYRDLRRNLAGERFDYLLHMQVAMRANIASTRIKATTKLGWVKARSRDLHQWFTHGGVVGVPQQHSCRDSCRSRERWIWMRMSRTGICRFLMPAGILRSRHCQESNRLYLSRPVRAICCATGR